MYLFKILVLELILKEKGSKPYWTDVHKGLSEKLLLPTEIGCVDSDLISSKCLLKNQEVQSKLLMTIKNTKVQNRNCLKTSSQLYKSIVVNRWGKEDIKTNQTTLLKALQIHLTPSQVQIKILKKYQEIYNYVYNKTVHQLKTYGNNQSFEYLRTLLVTYNTKTNDPGYIRLTNEKKQIYQLLKQHTTDKNTRLIEETKQLLSIKTVEIRKYAKTINATNNSSVKKWELEVPKDIRSEAVDDAIKAFDICKTNLARGNIKHFNISYKKKTDKSKCFAISKQSIKIKDGKIIIGPMSDKSMNNTDPGVLQMSSKASNYIQKNNILIQNTCRLTLHNGQYILNIPVKEIIESKTMTEDNIRYCGVDPGVRTFMTSNGPAGLTEYDFKIKVIDKINNKKKEIKKKGKQHKIKHLYKKMIKYDIKKKNHIDQLHWTTIKHLLDNNDVVFYGDIKSHDIVKNKMNHNLNSHINDLKFFQFKQRLLYKSKVRNKYVIPILENYTTKTCSSCGHQNDPGQCKIYVCFNENCLRIKGRDINASMNILLKGLVQIGVV